MLEIKELQYSIIALQFFHLRVRNNVQADKVLNFIRDYFNTTQKGFIFNNASQVRIITGQEEGINAWISVNYFQNNFKAVCLFLIFNF